MHIISISASVLASFTLCSLLPSLSKEFFFFSSFSCCFSYLLFSFVIVVIFFIAITYENTCSLRNRLVTFIMCMPAIFIFVHVRSCRLCIFLISGPSLTTGLNGAFIILLFPQMMFSARSLNYFVLLTRAIEEILNYSFSRRSGYESSRCQFLSNTLLIARTHGQTFKGTEVKKSWYTYNMGIVDIVGKKPGYILSVYVLLR